MSLVGVVGAIGVVLSIAFAWPQALAARRADDVSGVSSSASLLLLLTATTWTIYSLAVADVSLVVANLVTALAAAVTLEALVRRKHVAVAASILLVLAWALALAAVASLAGVLDAGPAPVGILAAALGISMSVPQAWRAARGHGVEGVALTTYFLLMGVMATWLAYGLLLGDPVIWFPNVLGLAVVGSVVAILAGRRDEPDARVMLETIGD
jgi:uncharacterized protein with PQ loop repeat